MCLAVPAQITALEGSSAVVGAGGVTQRVSTRLTPEARVGDYVLVHAGFAIQVVDPAEATETLALVEELSDLAAGDLPASRAGSGAASA